MTAVSTGLYGDVMILLRVTWIFFLFMNKIDYDMMT